MWEFPNFFYLTARVVQEKISPTIDGSSFVMGAEWFVACWGISRKIYLIMVNFVERGKDFRDCVDQRNTLNKVLEHANENVKWRVKPPYASSCWQLEEVALLFSVSTVYYPRCMPYHGRGFEHYLLSSRVRIECTYLNATACNR